MLNAKPLDTGSDKPGSASVEPVQAEISGRGTRSTSSRSRRTRVRVVGLLVLAGVLVLSVGASLAFGSGPAGPSDVLAIVTGQRTPQAWIVIGHRVPRTLLGLLVGAALAVAGLTMQALTRNPLADPGLLGVNAGAAAAVATCIAFFGITDVRGYVWFAFAGAGVVALLVYLLGSQGRAAATPERLVLAGAALSAVLTAYSSALVLSNTNAFDEFRFWQVGALVNRDMSVVTVVAGWIVAGLVIALLLSWPMNALALGEEIGRSLGIRVGQVRAAGAVTITLLCGAATAAAGPIGFLGLAVPHVLRFLLGPDLRWLMPYSILTGSILLLLADVLGRLTAGNGELEVGIVTAVLGAPLFIALVSRRRMVRP